MEFWFWAIVSSAAFLSCFGFVIGAVITVVNFRNMALKDGMVWAAATAACATVTILMAVVIYDAIFLL